MKLRFHYHGLKIVYYLVEKRDNAGAVANAGTAATFEITDSKLYVPVVALSTEDNAKLAKEFNEWFKRPFFLEQI